ncbi:MAG: hypothetical protein KBG54_01180 [Oscillospiraceae bacterium]|nr:hypothetical protein [Oscillospiraceae bacterium]
MNDKQRVLKLLQKKHELFLQYEKETIALGAADIDSMDDYITNRGTIANDIDAISAELANIFANSADKSMEEAAHCKCNDSKVSQDNRAMFEAGKAIFADLSRIEEAEKAINESMHLTREKLRERISETKNTPKIAKYLKNLAAGREESILLDADKKA